MKFTTLIPTHCNDGTRVDATEMLDILQEFWFRFDGVTVEGTTKGYWIDQGQVFEDECVKVVV